MTRQCHLNTCPAGIATQREDLRRRFHGTPEGVVRFFTSVAEEVREILSRLGHTRLADVVGRSELLEVAPPRPDRVTRVDVGALLESGPDGAARRFGGPSNDPPRTGQNLESGLLGCLRRKASRKPLAFSASITNKDPAVGAAVAGEITRRGLAGRPLPS